MNNTNLKQQICDALAAWIRQRPGLEWRNYYSNWTDKAGIAAYRSKQRSIARDKRDAETLLQAVRCRDSITAEDLIESAKHSFSGRLEIKVVPVTQVRHSNVNGAEATGVSQRVEIHYCTGQYWPTEYRKAAAAVLASALWAWQRESMPAPSGKVTRTSGVGPFAHESEHDSIEGLTPGDWLRKKFRKEFGSKMQRRWFD